MPWVPRIYAAIRRDFLPPFTAVKGVEDEISGEAIKAYLVLRPGEQATVESIRRELKGKLPEYKMPRHVEIRDNLPKNESGKIMKNEL